jgi:hypothetical protein
MVMVRQANQSLGQGMQDEINALIHTDLRQDRHVVAEREIHVEQTLILGNGHIGTAPPLRVSDIDFGPGRRKKMRGDGNDGLA